MNALIPDNWLRDFLKTKATTKNIAKCLTLCGPSVEKVIQDKHGPVYSIEVTTNRVDSIGIYGIAREAYSILPRFGFSTRLQPIKQVNLGFSKHVDYLDPEVDFKLCSRFTAVLIKNVSIKASPAWMQERLISAGVRPINNVVDISNYTMHELGQPVHTFDYDKITGAKMILRESKKGERVTTLDGKTHVLQGEDIVIEDGSGRLIDLAGIMGGENSAVDDKTKNVLLFVQTYNPVSIRKTSMALAQRTEAAELFEKGLDCELVTVGIQRAIALFRKLTGGVPAAKILDLYPNPYKQKVVSCSLNFINERLGIGLPKSEISKTLTPLGFSCKWSGNNLNVLIPSWRAKDVTIPEDIIEEVARIYGYHNLPSLLMTGAIPDPLPNSPFELEIKVKSILKSHGGVEVYTSSLVAKELVKDSALRLRNALGNDSEYLRTTLMPSLIAGAGENLGEKEAFHLFEMANVYLPRKGLLPKERMMLAGIFSGYSYRKAKGVIETLLTQLNIKTSFEPEDSQNFVPSQRNIIKAQGENLGIFGVLENSDLIYYIYYEFAVPLLRKYSKAFAPYKPISKYPPQIEDLTLVFPEKTKMGEVIKSIYNLQFTIYKIELKDIYKDAYTFRIWYQHPSKTLSNPEIEKIRTRILEELKQKFGGRLK